MYRSNVMVCAGTGCTSSGSDKIARAFEEEIKAVGLENEVRVVRTGCFGLCALGPVVVVYPEGSFYITIIPPPFPSPVQKLTIRFLTILAMELAATASLPKWPMITEYVVKPQPHTR